jgi:hypothetical protein
LRVDVGAVLEQRRHKAIVPMNSYYVLAD